MSRNARLFALVVALIGLVGSQATFAQAQSASEALKESARSGKPIFAIATSPTCPPCRQLKHTVRHDADVQAALADFVVLEMESSSADFADFLQQFPGEFFGVPMVHVISASGETLYARSGNLPPDQLTQLLNYGVRQSQAAVAKNQESSSQQSIAAPDYSEDLQAARVEALQGDLADALTRVTPIAKLQEESPDVTTARAYKDQLEAAIGDWLDDLRQEARDSDSQHASAYRLAKLYTQLPRETASRKKAGLIMKQLESSVLTRIAMQQAKELVRARYAEDRKMCEKAITTYQSVIELGASTPAAQYARGRIPMLEERQQLKVSSATR